MAKRLVLVSILLLIPIGWAWAQFEAQPVPQQEIVIYEGDIGSGANPVVLSGWGSGRAEEATAESYIGPKVLRVMTQGYYAGPRLDFPRPLGLADYWGKPNAYLRLALRPALAPPKQTETGTRVTAPSTPSAGFSRGRRQDRREERYGPTLPGTVGGAVSPAVTETVPTGEPEFRAGMIRLVLATDKGDVEIRDIPIEKDKKDERGWVKVAAPLVLFKGERGANVRRLMFYGDKSDIFYVGEIRLSLMPVTPITLRISADPVETQPGKPVKFAATAAAGLAPLELVWDFDASNGLQEDAKGKEVRNIYYKVGDYTVTCIVKDLTGGNEPFKRTLGVRIVAR